MQMFKSWGKKKSALKPLELALILKNVHVRISESVNAPTLTVSIMGHLDLQAGQTSVPVELTVVPVGFTIAPTHWPLVGLTALEQQQKKTAKWSLEVRKPSAFVWKWSHSTYLDTQTAWFSLLIDSTLSASTTEHVRTHFALALHFLQKTHKGFFFLFSTHGGAVLLLPTHVNALLLQ